MDAFGLYLKCTEIFSLKPHTNINTCIVSMNLVDYVIETNSYNFDRIREKIQFLKKVRKKENFIKVSFLTAASLHIGKQIKTESQSNRRWKRQKIKSLNKKATDKDGEKFSVKWVSKGPLLTYSNRFSLFFCLYLSICAVYLPIGERSALTNINK